MRYQIRLAALLILFMSVLSGMLSSLSAQEVRRATPVKSTPDEVARFLAGLPIDGESALTGLQSTSDYLTHHMAMQEAWEKCRTRRFESMSQWAEKELRSRVPTPSVVRYLFGGPDILTIMALFPDAPVVILCGLEPVGSVTPPEQLPVEQLRYGLAGLREATKTSLQFGYFITKEMRACMNGGPFPGVVPVLYASLALTGNQIISVDYPHLGGAPGVRIRFFHSGGPMQTLYYVQANLANDGSRSVTNWLASFGPGVAYLKAASYLLHTDGFSRTRDFLLSSSNAILEDDSGVPFHFFSPDRWSIYLFGDYRGPIELFRSNYQPDLHAAYVASPLRGPMPFGTGYQLLPGESGGANLLLAVRREFAPKAVPVR